MEVKVALSPKQILDRVDSSRDAIISGKERGVPALDSYLSAYSDFFRHQAETTTDPRVRDDAKNQAEKHQHVLEGDVRTKETFCFGFAQGLAAGATTADRMAKEENNPQFAKAAQRQRNEAVNWLLLSASLTDQDSPDQATLATNK